MSHRCGSVDATTEEENSRTRKNGERHWADRKSDRVCSLYKKELKDALDDLCDSFDHVGTRIGHLLHDGWVRPHTIGDCPDSSRGQSCSGTETLVAASAFKGRRFL